MTRFRRLLVVFFLIIAFFLTAGVAYAREVLDGEMCSIDAERVVDGNLFVLCGELTIDGHVEGHLMGAARTTIIGSEGQIDGSIYLLGGELVVRGSIGKDLHFGGLNLRVENDAVFEDENGGVISANLSSTIAEDARVPGSITDLGYQLIINGDVGQEVSFWGSALDINGVIHGDVTATVGNSQSGGVSSEIETLLIPFPFDVELSDPGLVLGPDARIEGQLEYRGPTPGRYDISQLENQPRYIPINQPLIGVQEERGRTFNRYLQIVFREFLALGIVGAISLLIAPHQMQTPLRHMQMRPLSTLGVGMLAFLLSFPIVLIIALFSILIVFILSLLPLNTVVVFGGVVLGLANIGGASVFYFTAIYIARVIVALAIGRFVVRFVLPDDGTLRFAFISMAVGVLLLAFAGSIPIVGWGFNALALFLGLGAILSVMRSLVRRFLDSTPQPSRPPARYPAERVPRLPYFSEGARQHAPPMLDDQPDGVGQENLPEGFDWWGEESD